MPRLKKKRVGSARIQLNHLYFYDYLDGVLLIPLSVKQHFTLKIYRCLVLARSDRSQDTTYEYYGLVDAKLYEYIYE